MIQQHGGTIININSIAGKTAYPYWSIYDASKFGLHAITQAVAEEQRHNNIKVVGIYPGAVATPIWEGLEPGHEPDPNGMLDAETIAESVIYILKQPRKAFISDITLSPLQPVL
jgi:NADP-dependent 3-hydroxy acid dehydrogenase YdfG